MATKAEARSDLLLANLLEAARLPIAVSTENTVVLEVIDLYKAIREEYILSVDGRVFEHWYGQYARALCSVAANIGEGEGRPSQAQKAQFYGYAHGSVVEATIFARLSGRSDLVDSTDKIARLCKDWIIQALSRDT